MIRKYNNLDLDRIYEIINGAAWVYKGIIPAEYWKEPYMSKEELRHELDEGIVLYGYEENGELVGVMGIQQKQDVTLIRHAYVCPTKQNRGIGEKLLSYLQKLTQEPILIATWLNDINAIRFYEKNGFRLVPLEEGYGLQRKYWSTPELKIKTSVVLGDKKWFSKIG
ncbi:MAG: GNAT family N-acetyltransferase [Candidatus Methanoperedens sp.]|nr:GNAT family N-acetyltransferase [Candidatus Methanoperedens sp.]MCZ7370085.1 GNAT family N-acetyltransferase [Candidatus Methanoperedens sp.]